LQPHSAQPGQQQQPLQHWGLQEGLALLLGAVLAGHWQQHGLGACLVLVARQQGLL
jgi:hypothetical protein